MRMYIVSRGSCISAAGCTSGDLHTLYHSWARICGWQMLHFGEITDLVFACRGNAPEEEGGAREVKFVIQMTFFG